MKKRLHYLIILTALLTSLSVCAQQAVRGTLRSTTGEPLPGATITVKGTGTSASSDVNGQFSINAPAGSTLVISYVGYATQEIVVRDANPLSIQLQASNQELQQLVVIGYQTVRKRDLTGATGIVNMTDASKVTAQSVGEAIQGLVSGVTVRNGGAPGSNPTIEIRGVSNFGNAQPLYVIDGMLTDANVTINPDDVASIQILKDASAAAIYGSRAGNGVIIITTKKGKDGVPKISVSARYGVQRIPQKWDVMNAADFLKTIKQQYQNSGAVLPAGIAAQVANNTIATDWQDEVYRTGPVQD
ncbi:MAG TPA: carboxypeptidase-like regulatory domain-containing protein [Flavisolibacter sp.]|nr:carboxypeptidase-like regulatory domain-containing protein [Flavisolibacter sp.]